MGFCQARAIRPGAHPAMPTGFRMPAFFPSMQRTSIRQIDMTGCDDGKTTAQWVENATTEKGKHFIMAEGIRQTLGVQRRHE
jgi:hypothetical protein